MMNERTEDNILSPMLRKKIVIYVSTLEELYDDV